MDIEVLVVIAVYIFPRQFKEYIYNVFKNSAGGQREWDSSLRDVVQVL